jgi:putative tricarboxylic transport membrane protein
MLIRERATLVFWFVLSFFFCIESYRLGLGSLHAPGPGFLTFWVSLVVGILAVVLFLQERGKRFLKDMAPLFKGKNLRNIIYANVFLYGYAVLFDKIGFFLCTLLFIGCCLKVIGSKKWKIVIWGSMSVAVGAYMVFGYWLAIQLPKGRWVESLLSLGDHLWK